MVMASHNPPDYNGMKFVRELSRPISADTGLLEIQALAERNVFDKASAKGGCIVARHLARLDRQLFDICF